jgi:hypothetical protein
MATEEQVGYADAIRQVYRALERRLHHLQDGLNPELPKETATDIRIRMDEVQHMIKVIESLHR